MKDCWDGEKTTRNCADAIACDWNVWCRQAGAYIRYKSGNLVSLERVESRKVKFGMCTRCKTFRSMGG